MPTIESRIAPDGAVTYRVKVRIKGARQVSASFSRKTEAAKWGHATEVAIREDRYFKSSASKQRTFANAVDRYISEVLPRKPRTAKFQAGQLAWWRAELGHLFLADVTAGAISVARAKLLKQPSRNKRARGPATANRYMAALSHVLSVSVREWEWLEVNTAQRLRKLKEPRGRDRFLSEEDCARLLVACRVVEQTEPSRRSATSHLHGHATQRNPLAALQPAGRTAGCHLSI